ncbi:hypothetical protein H7X46_12895 [Pseudonocardia sp. C8]|uniref:hypothetical protein n=1 Tax=Pseudonocardia sp. C8 TaxID=2762759 RepID=UPI0016435B8D|nr:hypothetical protein [Pseudonocardia sp. C8]MBC3191962.1 hypothetical protein [Pseudonocardia sp. C8]
MAAPTGPLPAWSRIVVSRRLLGAGAAAALAAAAVGALGIAGAGPSPVVAAVLAVSAAWLLAQSRSRVVVDDDGVRVEQALLRRTLAAVPISEITAARAGELDPQRLALSGYGVLRTSAVDGFRATRGGECLELGLADGRQFVVTVGDAAGAARAVTARLRSPARDDDRP